MDILPSLTSGQLMLLAAPRSILHEAVPYLIAHLALAGPVRILDGGNVFNLHQSVRCLRGFTPEYANYIDNIHIARAFTCYQMHKLLEDSISFSQGPTLILELLATFADENVRRQERHRLLTQSIGHLQRLSQANSTAVTISTNTQCVPAEWVSMLTDVSTYTWQFENKPLPITNRLL